jgi:hypothetical protein
MLGEAFGGVVDLVHAIFSPGDPDGEAGLRLHHQQALARLGYQITLTGPGDSTLPPGTDTPPTAAPSRAA